MAPAKVVAPETIIDGYTIGLPSPECPLENPECAKILSLVKSAALDSPAGRAQIEDCSLTVSECLAFTGQPAREGYARSAGLGEVVGLAESALLAENKDLDPAMISGFRLYSESLTPRIGADGQWLSQRTGAYSIVVFDFTDGSVHAAGVGCVVGLCHATR